MEIVGFVYILQCADDSYYIGSHRGNDVMTRVTEHQHGTHTDAYTFRKRPVTLVWSEYFYRYDEMVLFERQSKGWSRRKKEALINGEWNKLPYLSKRGFRPSADIDPSRRPFGPPQDEASRHDAQGVAPHDEASKMNTAPRPEEPRSGVSKGGNQAQSPL